MFTKTYGPCISFITIYSNHFLVTVISVLIQALDTTTKIISTAGPKPIFTAGLGAGGEISAVKMGIPDMHVNYIHDFLADRMHVDA